MTSLYLLAFRNLWVRKSRTLLTLSGVALGIIVVLFGLGAYLVLAVIYPMLRVERTVSVETIKAEWVSLFVHSAIRSEGTGGRRP